MPITAEELIRLVETDPELKRALQDRLVDAEAIQRALRDPEKRKEIRRAVLGEEWEDIPTILRQLAEGQQRHEAILQEHTRQLAMLIETQQRHEAILQEHSRILQEHTQLLQEHSRILQEHTQQLAMLIETQQRHEAILQEHSRILQEHTQQLAMLIETQQRHEAILQEHSRILQEHTQQLAMLIETQQRHEAILQEHSRILQEHTQQLAMLIETQQRHEAILQEHSRILQEHTQQLAMLIETQQRHEAILQHHTTILMHLEEEARALRQEFSGLAGRFEGEAYEKRTVRRAPSIFNGGGGGSPDSPRVQRRLRRWLRKVFGGIPSSAEEEDIYAADLIWWKDGHVVVAEISLKIDRLDVLRAKRRAQLLSQAGVNAIPVVIGNEWTMQ
ncbi:MAG: hypothetical protein N2554_03095, partial [Fimbriimonadales bacterium]|nr:hypothetical protein [Fimbriimonadales bacterium]